MRSPSVLSAVCGCPPCGLVRVIADRRGARQRERATGQFHRTRLLRCRALCAQDARKLVDRHGAGRHAVPVGRCCRTAVGRGLAGELVDDGRSRAPSYALGQLVTRARGRAGRRRAAPPPSTMQRKLSLTERIEREATRRHAATGADETPPIPSQARGSRASRRVPHLATSAKKFCHEPTNRIVQRSSTYRARAMTSETKPRASIDVPPPEQADARARNDSLFSVRARAVAGWSLAFAFACAVTLVIVLSTGNDDLLATVALALAIMAFALQIAFFMVQLRVAGEQDRRSQDLYRDTSGVLTKIDERSAATVAVIREQFDFVLRHALGQPTVKVTDAAILVSEEAEENEGNAGELDNGASKTVTPTEIEAIVTRAIQANLGSDLLAKWREISTPRQEANVSASASAAESRRLAYRVQKSGGTRVARGARHKACKDRKC